METFRDAYCLFCATGDEGRTAREISRLAPELTVLPVLQEKHRSVKGARENYWAVMLPGYVFVYADECFPRALALRALSAYRFLRYTDGDERLAGGDLEFARLVFRYDGRLGSSRAVLTDSRVRILDGPLKDMEGRVTAVNKRNRNGRVEISFGGRSMNVWLAFDYVEVLEEEKGGKTAGKT